MYFGSYKLSQTWLEHSLRVPSTCEIFMRALLPDFLIVVRRTNLENISLIDM